ncbi:MAG: RagB/SusD family nutrient uptake outer membrane protein [Prevotellaceae bacterium]|jgi:hypothetical protein|nr:RagB/SusD family nutrient uptake outer membrane protein [Prevotellaceae bacterium]
MKKIRKYISVIIFGGIFSVLSTSCNDFLEREPLDGFTDQNYWSSEANVKAYAWRFYNLFMGYGKGTGTTAEYYFQSASASTSVLISDDLTSNTFLQYQPNASASNSNWSDLYEYIRRANIMLERLPNVPMDNAAREHWEGVARFFRAYYYFRLVQRFGDVPYYDSNVTDLNNVQVVFLPRINRNEVMDKVKADINSAVNLLKEQPEVTNTNVVNKYVGLALKSRICLYEGTYRKYHQLGNGTEYLQDAKSAANEIMTSNKYSIGSNYKAVYNSENLKGNSEILLYKEYLSGVAGNSIQAYTNTSTVVNGMTKAAIESYVCTDGLPISQSSQYQGDVNITDVLANRDERLIAAIDDEGVSFRGYPIASLSRARTSSSGYVVNLYYNPASPSITTTGQNFIDAPVFDYAEVLLNYAEACAELGSITQSNLDSTVNLLRARAGITPLTYVSDDNIQVGGVTINDPKRTNALENISGAVNSIIWEIRRERRTELMGWTEMRYYDLMRWGKGDYLDYTNNPDVALGIYVGVGVTTDVTVNDDGYVYVYPGSNRVFDSNKHYLNSIPTGQISLYNGESIELTQNPGW